MFEQLRSMPRSESKSQRDIRDRRCHKLVGCHSPSPLEHCGPTVCRCVRTHGIRSHHAHESRVPHFWCQATLGYIQCWGPEVHRRKMCGIEHYCMAKGEQLCSRTGRSHPRPTGHPECRRARRAENHKSVTNHSAHRVTRSSHGEFGKPCASCKNQWHDRPAILQLTQGEASKLVCGWDAYGIVSLGMGLLSLCVWW